MSRRRPVDTLLALAGFVVVVAGLRYAGPVLVPILLAACIAAASAPIALMVRARGGPTWLGPLVAMVVDMLLVGVVVLLMVSSVNEFQERLPDYTQRLSNWAVHVSGWLANRGIDVPAQSLYKVADPGALFTFVGNTLTSLASLVIELVLVLLVTFFVLFELSTFRDKLGAVVGDGDVERFETIVHEVQRYLMVKTLLSVLTGALIGIFLAILQIDFTVLLALAAFALNFVPNIGSILSAVPAVFVALVQRGPGTAVAVLIGYVAVHTVVGNIVEPRVLGKALGLSPLVVLLSMLVWGWMWGPAGALLSVPLTMVVKIVFANNEDLKWVATLLGPPGATSPGPPAPPSGPGLLDRVSSHGKA